MCPFSFLMVSGCPVAGATTSSLIHCKAESTIQLTIYFTDSFLLISGSHSTFEKTCSQIQLVSNSVKSTLTLAIVQVGLYSVPLFSTIMCGV